MKKIKQFHEDLREALENRKLYLESEILQKTRELFKTYYSAFNAVYMLLLKKALIKDDPYKHEYRLSEISLPPSTQIVENEKGAQLGIRLSVYNTQIDYINNYYSFNLEFFNNTRIKLVTDLLNFIDWDSIAEVSNNPSTRVLAAFLNKIRQGNDQISISVINTSLNQLSSIRKLILENLSLLKKYHHENYKFKVRDKVLMSPNMFKYASENSSEDTLSVIRKKITESMTDAPFIKELISEILEEEFSADSEDRKEDLLSELNVTVKTEQKKEKQISIKPPSFNILVNGAITICSASIHIKSLLGKTEHNFNIIEEPRGSVFMKWLYKIIYRGKARGRVFEIEYIDDLSGTKKTEKLEYSIFIKKYLTLLSDINGAKLKTNLSNIESKEKKEDFLLVFIGRYNAELKNLIQQFTGIEKYIKQKAKNENIPSADLKGFLLDINSIKNSIIKSQQLSHEYVSGKEEYNQFKALGIADRSLE